ncbi:MAG: dihydropteroate synthase [Thermoplasmata archaeon]|nr:MAG: dihydropteroate synthase [Thermoplasmata archaeon]
MVNRIIQCGKYSLEFGKRTLVMGIVNVTPDSFSDGGHFFDCEKAVAHAEYLASQGADIIDVGGESTRPGSEAISLEEEIGRVVPVIERTAKKVKVPISIDTCKSEVAKAALDSGASIINDISALRFDPKVGDVAVKYNAPLILMHMKGTPRDMQKNPTYTSAMDEIKEFLKKRVEFTVSKGYKRNNIIIDPGIGFGKSTGHNYEIIRKLGELKELDLPILIGTSRKSFIGNTLDLDVDERLEGTLATVTMCAMNGADIVRVHDVKETVRVVRMTDAIYR